MQIRVAAPEDAAALLSVYAPYVERTAITFEYEAPSVAEFENRICRTLEKYPWLAAEENGIILGYAYAAAFKARAAYAWSAETSIYVREGAGRQGIGTLLYKRLEDILRGQHICNLCACITYPNPASISFHEGFGYKMSAHFTSSGFKQGIWHDMVWMEKTLCPHEIPPRPFIPFPALAEAK